MLWLGTCRTENDNSNPIFWLKNTTDSFLLTIRYLTGNDCFIYHKIQKLFRSLVFSFGFMQHEYVIRKLLFSLTLLLPQKIRSDWSHENKTVSALGLYATRRLAINHITRNFSNNFRKRNRMILWTPGYVSNPNSRKK